MPVTRDDFYVLWKLSRSGNEAKVQEQIEESDAVTRNLVNLKHHRKGTTPLMEAAASKCNEPVVAKLIAAGADVNIADDTKLRNTALHYAAMTKSDPLATESLLEAGADAFAVNRKGFTPLDVARQYGRKAVGAVLLEHMKVHAGWLFLRGKFHWSRRWAVVVACNKKRTSTELCIFHHQDDLRPSLVILIDEAARMTQFPCTDSYLWLQRENAFVFDKPVMCHRVKGNKFTRSPICKKTISMTDVQTIHYVFAADSLNNLAQWRRVLQSSNFNTRESRLSLHRSSPFEAQNSELYYWPQDLVENLRSSILREQEQQREEADDPLYQRLRATFEQRRPTLTLSPTGSNEPAVEPTQTPTQDILSNVELVDGSPQSRNAPGQSVDHSLALEHCDQNRVHFAPLQSIKHTEVSVTLQYPLVDGQRTASNTSTISGREVDVSECATQNLPVTDNESRSSLHQQSSNQVNDEDACGAVDNQSQQDEGLQLSKAPEEPQSDLCDICDVTRRNAVCTPCGHLTGCSNCLKTIMRTSKACPECRMPMRSVLNVESNCCV